MSELPVIATNFSGPTHYMTDSNSFPLAFSHATNPFDGSIVAEPSVSDLERLLLEVVQHRVRARAEVGRQAARDMRAFAPEAVVDRMMALLQPSQQYGPHSSTGPIHNEL